MAKLDDDGGKLAAAYATTSTMSTTAGTGFFSPGTSLHKPSVDLRRDSSGRALTAAPKHYMRSSSDNPLFKTPKLCEHPICAVAAAPAQGWASRSAGALGQQHKRPVNRRDYYSPAYWVRDLEEGKYSQKASLLDFNLSYFHTWWKDECEKEHARNRPRIKPPRTQTPEPVREKSPPRRLGPPPGRSSLLRMTQYSASAPTFWRTEGELRHQQSGFWKP